MSTFCLFCAAKVHKFLHSTNIFTPFFQKTLLFVKKNTPNSTSSPHPLHLSTSSIPPPPRLHPALLPLPLHLLPASSSIHPPSHRHLTTHSPPSHRLSTSFPTPPSLNRHPAISQPPPRLPPNHHSKLIRLQS